MLGDIPLPVLWDDRYLTGLTEIDIDHRTLVTLQNDVITAIQRQVSFQLIRSMLRTQQRHLQQHFRREEALMVCLSYPDAARHAQEHQAFEAILADALEQADTPAGVSRVVALARTWVVGHLEGGDRPLLDWIRTMRDSQNDGADAPARNPLRPADPLGKDLGGPRLDPDIPAWRPSSQVAS